MCKPMHGGALLPRGGMIMQINYYKKEMTLEQISKAQKLSSEYWTIVRVLENVRRTAPKINPLKNLPPMEDVVSIGLTVTSNSSVRAVLI